MARIAVVLGNDFEDVEFRQPADCLTEAGHQLTVVGSKPGEVEGKRHQERVTVEATPADVRPDQFDALLIPGGFSPDHLRTDETIVAFVKHFHDDGKLIAAVCHGPSLLVDAEVVRDHRLTSWPSIRKDLVNAGGVVVDEEVVVDGKLITSRKPDDLPAFCNAILENLPG
ncbi:MAG: type 1 glutamine amidotransferase domain-containing protein [Pseudomonadota bacterium]